MRVDRLAAKQKPIESATGGCYLSVEAQPGAKRTGIAGLDEWRGAIRISVKSPPLSGKANEELVELLESIFPEAKGFISIARGERSRSKKIFLPVTEKKIREKLSVPK